MVWQYLADTGLQYLLCLKREESVYHKPQDPFRIVIGPVSISFIGRAVKLWAYFDQNTVIGLGG
jgi:hypothetical protein